MQRLLLGDNQFFGINHMSEAKAQAQSIRFQDISSVISVIDDANRAGITGFMCTTHERVALICDHIRAHPDQYRDYVLLPCMPYAHKYANAMAEHGTVGAIQHFIGSRGLLDAVLRGGVSVAKKDIEGVITLLVDTEMRMFAGLRTPVVFLQNVVVDLLIGLRMTEAFRIFASHVRQRYGAEPGFITMNMPRLLDLLEEAGIENPIVCTNINKAGFRMCGGMTAYMTALRDRQFRCIAMSVFASGAIPADEAIEWVSRVPNVETIVFGASTRENIQRTAALVTHHFASRSARR